MREKITVSQLYNERMVERPESFRVSLELVLPKLDKNSWEILRNKSFVKNGITRDVIVPADITLHSLSFVIEKLFGWQHSHLHQFILPKEIFQKLTGGKEKEDEYGYCIYDGKITDWIRLCGLYFRFPSEDFDDLCWDDDYQDGENIRTWFRKKYTGPYRYGGTSEKYHIAHEMAKELYNIKPNIENLTIDDVMMGFIGRMDELIERIPLQNILMPYNTVEDEDILEKIYSLACLQEKTKKELPVYPITDELMYAYDFGDGWKVKIRILDCYFTKDGVNRKTLKDKRAYDMNNTFLNQDLTNKIVKVVHKRRPICIAADGLSLMDDVGGINGYINYLQTIYGTDPKQGQKMKWWGECMGWSDTMFDLEKIL